MKFLLVIFFCVVYALSLRAQVLIPIQTADRRSLNELKLTEIGNFGLLRKERKNIRAHLHTGIDIRRPHPNYQHEPIFPLTKGVVISKRDDGPYAQLIIEHSINNKKIWTVYEHIAGITCNVNDSVEPTKAIARFMNKSELNKYGWQFDHFHFEILREKPIPLAPDGRTPQRFFNSYSLVCYSEKDLEKYFYSPQMFMKNNLRN